jgi:hypothetical protein
MADLTHGRISLGQSRRFCVPKAGYVSLTTVAGRSKSGRRNPLAYLYRLVLAVS